MIIAAPEGRIAPPPLRDADRLTYDIHVHYAAVGAQQVTDGFLRRPNAYVRMFLKQIGVTPAVLRQADAGTVLRERFLHWVRSSALDRHVVLAMDWTYDEGGRRREDASAFVLENQCVADLAATEEKILFGASVHPFRPDALAELERWIGRGACLVKWIPSAQRIRLEDPRCLAFYDVLAARGVPLLVHTGNEHATSHRRNAWNDPALLVHALERGVTVIAAHCGARLFLHERCYFGTFCRMAGQYDTLYGDISAFGLPTRVGLLRTLAGAPDLLRKIVYGSDFPATVWPWWCAWALGPRAAAEVARERHPLRRPLLFMQRMGMPAEVFTRAGSLLRLARRAGGSQ